MQLVMNPSSHKEFPEAYDEEMPSCFNLTAEQKGKLYGKTCQVQAFTISSRQNIGRDYQSK